MTSKDSIPSPPLVSHIYTADPSAHNFNGRLYVYPSHDRETDIKFNDNGDQYDMFDYHVISLDSSKFNPDDLSTVKDAAVDHGVALSAEQIPWVSKQVWAPDAAYNEERDEYCLFFPARDKEGRFRVGIARSKTPEGPFSAEPEPIKGSYSIDPCSFVDDDGSCYLYFGGVWGGELQCYKTPNPKSEADFDASMLGPKERTGEGVSAMGPRVGRMRKGDWLEFDKDGLKEIDILDEKGSRIAADDHERRFFEAAWMHKYQGKYYFSYSTGDTHKICYAVGDGPRGPFTYRGMLFGPVVGWTNHHSVVEYGGRWWVFYHDCEMSGGVDHLRSVRMREAWHNQKGDMTLVKPEE